MAEPWPGQALQALPATVLGMLGSLGSEFLQEWEAQDMRVTLFKLLLLWSGRPKWIHTRWLYLLPYLGDGSKRTCQNSQRIREDSSRRVSRVIIRSAGS
ncbi:T-cell leukemia translocation-altered gene protein isoform X2 [Perognathus longimembris pacificus]|uniref:T-cell leukemia translocation-altered gene protein isoform X2 n=1 Tax=Perognathus longimembris pacificus TaxID=214514 RepID=UPI00201980BA|nr:T-cell leukemia translocation-altered gene protein isoform X2 [Perognathus longimembris pacificus]